MNKTRALLIAVALVAICAGAAQATPIDPVIIVRGGTGSIHLTNLNPFPINFSGTPGCTGGTWNVPQNDPTAFVNGQQFLSCVFVNLLASHADITSLTFFLNPPNQPLTLINQPWLNQNTSYFTQTSFTQNFASATFSVGSVPWGREFEVILIGFSIDTVATMAPSAVPEPATLGLMGIGLLALARRVRKSRR